jgi:hypothetical protein
MVGGAVGAIGAARVGTAEGAADPGGADRRRIENAAKPATTSRTAATQRRRARLPVRPARSGREVSIGCAANGPTLSSAAANSSAEEKRRSRFFSSARMTMEARAGPVLAGRRAVSSGGGAL